MSLAHVFVCTHMHIDLTLTHRCEANNSLEFLHLIALHCDLKK